MSKLLEGVTIETFPKVARQSRIRPEQPKLAEIATTMGVTAAERGMTTEVFDAILARK